MSPYVCISVCVKPLCVSTRTYIFMMFVFLNVYTCFFCVYTCVNVLCGFLCERRSQCVSVVGIERRMNLSETVPHRRPFSRFSNKVVLKVRPI